MQSRSIYWYNRRFLDAAALAEIAAAEPSYLVASLGVWRWGRRKALEHHCSLYLIHDYRTHELVAEGFGATGIGAFRAACARIVPLPVVA